VIQDFHNYELSTISLGRPEKAVGLAHSKFKINFHAFSLIIEGSGFLIFLVLPSITTPFRRRSHSAIDMSLLFESILAAMMKEKISLCVLKSPLHILL
jgi:hypothetical protein